VDTEGSRSDDVSLLRLEEIAQVVDGAGTGHGFVVQESTSSGIVLGRLVGVGPFDLIGIHGSEAIGQDDGHELGREGRVGQGIVLLQRSSDQGCILPWSLGIDDVDCDLVAVLGVPESHPREEVIHVSIAAIPWVEVQDGCQVALTRQQILVESSVVGDEL